MKLLILLWMLVWVMACNKPQKARIPCCDIEAVYALNQTKTSVQQGIWGTVSEMQGNCMPTVGGQSTCSHCPVTRKVQVYGYTLVNQAVLTNRPGFYASFNTPLLAETMADKDGFYQLNLPAGNYSVVIVENGQLYASGSDGWGGIGAIQVGSGSQKLNLLLTYRAVF
jgi:uncharacterized protein YegP (UPF0339 family)